VAILTRSVIALFVLLAGVWIARIAHSRLGAVVFLCAAGAVVFPWVLRNSLLAGRPEGVEVSLGYNLYMGYYPQGTGTFQYGPSMDLVPILDDVQRDRVGLQKAEAFIRGEPGRIPYLIVRKAGYFFGLEKRAVEYFYANDFLGYLPAPVLIGIGLLLLLPFVFTASAAGFGAVWLPGSNAKTLVGLLILGYLAPHLLILAEDRFHMTLIPCFAVLAAAAVVRRREILASLRAPQDRWRWLVPAVFALLLLFNWGHELWADAPHLAALLGPNGNTLYPPY
jgi:hypothetical protein